MKSSVSAIDKDFPITAKDIGKATLQDPVLSKVLHLAMTGWPEKCDEKDLNPITLVHTSSLVNRTAFCGAPG